jgi:hypothetical protein
LIFQHVFATASKPENAFISASYSKNTVLLKVPFLINTYSYHCYWSKFHAEFDSNNMLTEVKMGISSSLFLLFDMYARSLFLCEGCRNWLICWYGYALIVNAHYEKKAVESCLSVFRMRCFCSHWVTRRTVLVPVAAKSMNRGKFQFIRYIHYYYYWKTLFELDLERGWVAAPSPEHGWLKGVVVAVTCKTS